MKQQPAAVVSLVSLSTHLNFVEFDTIQIPKLRRGAMRDASGWAGPKRCAPYPLDPGRLRPTHAPYAWQLAHPLSGSHPPVNLVTCDSQPLQIAPRNEPMPLLRDLLELKVGPIHDREQKTTPI
jgi:hypothetical protein